MAEVTVLNKHSSKSQKSDWHNSSRTDIENSLNANTHKEAHRNKSAATSADLPSAAESELIKTHALKDRGKVVALAYVMLGNAYMIPWATISTATSFYTDFKLSWLSSSLKDDASALSRIDEYRSFFINYLGIIVQIPNLLSAVINLLFVSEKDPRPRLLKCLEFLILFTNCILILALLDTRSWPEINIMLTFLISMGLCSTSGFLSSFIWESSGDFVGMEMSINLGTSLCGILTALFAILSKVYASHSQATSSTASPTISSNTSSTASSAASSTDLTPSQHQRVALMYYMISLVLCCATYVLYGGLRYNKYYRCIHREVVLKKEVVVKTCKGEVLKLKPVLKGTWRLQITLLYLLTITLLCFPALQLGIVPQPSFPAPLYYYEIVCFLTFNVASMIGNFVTLKAKCPGPGKVWIVVVLRTLFVPILMFCNYKPEERRTPVLFHHDSIHGVTSTLLGFSNGYLITLLMEQIAQKAIADGLNVGLALKLGSVMILSGIAIGILLSLLLAKFATI